MNYSNIDCSLYTKSPATSTAKGRQLTVIEDRAGRRHLVLHRAGAPLRRGFRLLTQLGAAFVVLLAASVQSHAQIVIQPLVEADSKDTKIYDTLPTLSLQSDLNVVSQDVGAHFLSLVQFDLAAITLTAAEITNATLTLYSTGLGISGGPAVGGTVTISPILTEWRETSSSPGTAPLATYNAFFGTGTAQTLNFGSAAASQNVTGAGFVDWDITDLVKSWKDGSQENYGVLIQLSTNGGDIGFADVDSQPGIAGSSPKLTIVPEPGTTLLAFAGLGVMFLRRNRPAAR
jgi:hypothetical protein